MPLSQAKLIKKINLTHDVFELHYDLGEKKQMLSGQFITFILSGIGGRAYSILEMDNSIIKLIIKRWPSESGGRGGSMLLCDARVGETFSYVGPSGHFLLKASSGNKLFLGTGTGLVPLYNMIIDGLSQNTGSKFQLVFGVRTHSDMFYQKGFEKLKTLFPDTFYYHLVVSREEEKGIIKKGYVTDFLSETVVSSYEDFYLCGAPGMIESCQEKLEYLGVSEDNVFYEKY